jgi:Zn-dependent peptidase ImmA (M78 family)
MDKQTLLRLQDQFRTDEAIGKHLGVSKQAVEANRRRLGIPKKEKYPEFKKIVLDHSNGIKPRILAKKYGVPVEAIYKMVSHYKKKVLEFKREFLMDEHIKSPIKKALARSKER